MTAKISIRYIDDTTAQVTKAFQKNACIFGTEEFKLWREYLICFPKAKMTTKTIKKNPDKKNTRNLTYDNMKEFIETLPEKKTLLAEFETIKKRSKVQKHPYGFVLNWFEGRFQEYKNYKAFLSQKEEERVEKEKQAASENAEDAQNDE